MAGCLSSSGCHVEYDIEPMCTGRPTPGPTPRPTPSGIVSSHVFCMACGAKCNQNYQGMDEHYPNGVGFYICDCTYGSSCYAFPNLTPHLAPHPTPLSTPPGSGVSHRTPPGSENFATRRLCDSCFFKFNVLLLLLQQGSAMSQLVARGQPRVHSRVDGYVPPACPATGIRVASCMVPSEVSSAITPDQSPDNVRSMWSAIRASS